MEFVLLLPPTQLAFALKTYNKMKRKLSTSGFTLIETLIVVTVVGLIAVISFRYIATHFKKARDGERRADMKLVRNYIEQFYTDERHYPWTGDGVSNFNTLRTLLTNRYLTRLSEVEDPGLLNYTYSYNAGIERYCLCAELEIANGNSGANCDFNAASQDHFCQQNAM